MRRRAVAVVLVTVLAVSACGSDEPALTDRASRRLEDQIAAVEFAVAGGEYQAARQGLGEIRATTIRLADRRRIHPERVPLILAAVEDVEGRLVRLESTD